MFYCLYRFKETFKTDFLLTKQEREEFLLYAYTHQSIFEADGHIILTPANQMFNHGAQNMVTVHDPIRDLNQ
jgi:hypothetical protein